MTAKYIVVRICDIPPGSKRKIMHDPTWDVEDYCGVAAALNLGVVTPEVMEHSLAWSQIEDWMWLDPSEMTSLAICRAWEP